MRTMKIMKRMMGLAAAILALSACSESEDLLSAFHSDPNAVRITAEVGKASANGFTRSYPLGDAEAQKKFKEGDMISVKADGQDAVTYQLNGTEWQPKESSKFLKWESDEMTFTAYYPASFDGNLDNITLPEKYDEASLAANDFMSFSEKRNNAKGNQLTLTMERKMARVVVEIDGFNDQYTGATINNVNSLSICGIKAYKHSDNKFYALIKPCAAQNSETFISLDVAEGESKTTEKLTGIPALTAGNSYTYKLKVGKNKISVSGITVKDWNTEVTIPGGKAEYKAPPYVTFTADEEQTFIMSAQDRYEISGLEYSVNNGTWKKVVTGEAVTFGGSKGTLSLRGKNNLGGTSGKYSGYSRISFGNTDVNVACTGDIRTLLDYENYETVATGSARFSQLFENCKQLTSAPDLPAKTLADGCYSYMFHGCSKLETGPVKLPALKLATRCYDSMFLNCSSLQTAPDLPATELAEYCYMGMFRDCTNLKNVPDELPAKTMYPKCYLNMFTGCSSLEGGPKLPATTLAESCYKNMFENCIKLKTAPELKAMSLKESCYSSMFWGCTSLTAAPDLPATELAEYCYAVMFRGCKNLKTGPVNLPALKLATKCYDSMFFNCSSLQTAPDLPATELAEYCYNGMFCGCENLSSVKMLAPSAQIKSVGFSSWLSKAGTSAASRKLIVQDEAAYNALVNTGYLPAIWKKDATNTTVENYTPKP